MQQVEKHLGGFSELKYNCYVNFRNNATSLRELTETSFMANFLELRNYGVKLSLFEPNHVLDNSARQKEPDLQLNFEGSVFKDQRCHGLDQKSSVTSIGRSNVFSNVKEQVYRDRLDIFLLCFSKETKVSPEIRMAFRQLKDTCGDLQIVWASNLHLFPASYIPPLIIFQLGMLF